MNYIMSVQNMSTPGPQKSIKEQLSIKNLKEALKTPEITTEETVLNALLVDGYKIRINGKEVALDTKYLKTALSEAKKLSTHHYPTEYKDSRQCYLETKLRKVLELTLSRVVGLIDITDIETFALKVLKSIKTDVAAGGIKDGINFIFKKQ